MERLVSVLYVLWVGYWSKSFTCSYFSFTTCQIPGGRAYLSSRVSLCSHEAGYRSSLPSLGAHRRSWNSYAQEGRASDRNPGQPCLWRAVFWVGTWLQPTMGIQSEKAEPNQARSSRRTHGPLAHLEFHPATSQVVLSLLTKYLILLQCKDKRKNTFFSGKDSYLAEIRHDHGWYLCQVLTLQSWPYPKWQAGPQRGTGRC